MHGAPGFSRINVARAISLPFILFLLGPKNNLGKLRRSDFARISDHVRYRNADNLFAAVDLPLHQISSIASKKYSHLKWSKSQRSRQTSNPWPDTATPCSSPGRPKQPPPSPPSCGSGSPIPACRPKFPDVIFISMRKTTICHKIRESSTSRAPLSRMHPTRIDDFTRARARHPGG